MSESSQGTSPLRRVFKFTRQLFTLGKHESPFFVHGLLCGLWRLADLIPGGAGYLARRLIGKYRLGSLGTSARISSHNTFFDGRNVEIGDHFSSGKYNYFAGGAIRIGNDVSLANYVIIETTGHHFDDLTRPIREQGTYRKSVVIGDNVWIGNRATILGGVTVGDGAVIGASAIVTKDVPPDSVVVDNPARVIRKRGEQQQPSNEVES
jgi:maltose O-acetyltransferase